MAMPSRTRGTSRSDIRNSNQLLILQTRPTAIHRGAARSGPVVDLAYVLSILLPLPNQARGQGAHGRMAEHLAHRDRSPERRAELGMDLRQQQRVAAEL